MISIKISYQNQARTQYQTHIKYLLGVVNVVKVLTLDILILIYDTSYGFLNSFYPKTKFSSLICVLSELIHMK